MQMLRLVEIFEQLEDNVIHHAADNQTCDNGHSAAQDSLSPPSHADMQGTGARKGGRARNKLYRHVAHQSYIMLIIARGLQAEVQKLANQAAAVRTATLKDVDDKLTGALKDLKTSCYSIERRLNSIEGRLIGLEKSVEGIKDCITNALLLPLVLTVTGLLLPRVASGLQQLPTTVTTGQLLWLVALAAAAAFARWCLLPFKQGRQVSVKLD